MTSKATDYQPCNDHGGARSGGGKLVGQILVCSALQGPCFCEEDRPGQDYAVDPLVLGGIRAHIKPLVSGAEWREWKWLPYLLALALSLVRGDGASTVFLKEMSEELFAILFIGLIGLGWCLDWCVVRRFTQCVAAITENDVNVTLQPLGYSATYSVDSTGECYINEHRINLFILDPAVERLRTVELLARLPRPWIGRDRRPVDVCIYGTPFQHMVAWFCNWNRPAFISDTCPVEGIPTCLWGSMQHSFRVPRLETLQRRHKSLLIFWILVTLWQVCEDISNWWFPILFFSPLLLVLAFVSHNLWSTSKTVGHPQWYHAVQQWNDAVLQFGYRIEYRHSTFEPTCCTSPDFWILFVPMPLPSVTAEGGSVQV